MNETGQPDRRRKKSPFLRALKRKRKQAEAAEMDEIVKTARRELAKAKAAERPGGTIQLHSSPSGRL